MKILVTGGGGFLGSAICRQLLARGDEVISYQRSAAPELEALGVTCIQGDLLDFDLLSRSVSGCDVVIHTAGKAGVWGSYESYYQVNVLGTENVISACRANDIRYLVHTSSPSVAHGGGDIEGGDETLPYPKHFSAPYPASKALGEQLILAANGDQLQTVSIRPHLIWGPGDPHLLPRLMARSIKGRIKLPGGDKLIDTIFIDNAAGAHLSALDSLQNNGRCAGKAYFISNGEPLTQADIMGRLLIAAGIDVEIGKISPLMAKSAGAVLETIWKIFRLSSEPPITRWSAEQLSSAHWYDISAAKRDLNYRVDVSIDQGLKILAEQFGA